MFGGIMILSIALKILIVLLLLYFVADIVTALAGEIFTRIYSDQVSRNNIYLDDSFFIEIDRDKPIDISTDDIDMPELSLKMEKKFKKEKKKL